MMQPDIELLSRIPKVNAASGEIMLRVLSGIADDDAASADFAAIGALYTQLGAAFTQRAEQLAADQADKLDP
ncbi:MAG: hypothetical protein JWQ81_8541 [Amycolatopsis sp.]|uniref:hypothetical protein n=1 Tax=Amycolatopsis sp. TaxID=37632 RepID=UPI00262B3E7A|nr:hypothetical protein [Amycolatopsis sp.]MCU1687802.1 hypothetical protein [Amycolatopsis sp.]